MEKIAKEPDLVRTFNELVEAHVGICSQRRTYQRVIALIIAELFAFGRHTVTQLLFVLGAVNEDWSVWYRLFSKKRIDLDKANEILFRESLKHVKGDEVYVTAGDGTQTPRTGKKIEGVGWLRSARSPAFKVGIHKAQRWFHGAWLMPAENGYSRAMPLRWMSAFTEKSYRSETDAKKEWERAIEFLEWTKKQLKAAGRINQKILMVADGAYDTLNMWKQLPDGCILLARSAKNRVLHHPLEPDAHKNRKYGERAPTPKEQWAVRTGWTHLTMKIRGRMRTMRVRSIGPFYRKGAPNLPLFLILIGGKTYMKNGKKRYRAPRPYLVNAVLAPCGNYVLPLPLETLVFWAWQRWEIEVCHRELKSNFGLGHKQCWNTASALLSVQWSAWVYSLLLLAGYRAWGLSGSPDVPTVWWRGSGRWSFNTLCRSYRAAFWGTYHFRPLWPRIRDNLGGNIPLLGGLTNAAFGSSRL